MCYIAIVMLMGNFNMGPFHVTNRSASMLSLCFYIQCMSFNLGQQQTASYCYLF